MTKQTSILGKLLVWRIRNISDKQFIIGLSILIGIVGAIAAVILKTTVHFIHNFLLSQDIVNVFYLALPFLGIFITVAFMKYLLKHRVGHGIVRILQSISKNNSKLHPKGTWAYMVTSSITVGFGGSVGLEAPIVATGSSLGSYFGQLFHLNYKHKTLLIGCGAAAAIASIFNAPVTGVIFALEVLMLDLTMSSMIPLLIASVTGAISARFLIGDNIFLNVELTESFIPSQFPLFILLGILAGFTSRYFTRITLEIDKRIASRKGYLRKTLIGGILIGILIFIFPPLFGDGHITVFAILGNTSDSLLDNTIFSSFCDNAWGLVGFLFLVLLFKVFATALTISSGGVGGVFAPALFMGGLTGFLFARIGNLIGSYNLSEKNFALVGMAGLIAGVQHAPLTAIFLVSELSNGYDLFIPLMITSASSYLTAKFLNPHSIYTGKLMAEKALITHNKDQAAITLMNFRKLIEKDFAMIQMDGTLRNVVTAVSKSSRNIYPVIDENGVFKGVIQLDDIRNIMFQTDLYDETTVESLMHEPMGIIDMTDEKEDVMELFKNTGAWNLPVIENKKYVGFISRSKLFTEYRRVVAKHSDH